MAHEKRDPSQAALHCLLEHYQNGRYGDAEKLGKSITQQFPRHQLSWKVLAATLNQTGKFQESLIPIQKAVGLEPSDVEAHIILGSALQELGRLEDAEASHRKAIALKPDFAAAHYCLGITLQALGRLEDAETSYRNSIAFNPVILEAHYNLGNTLQELGRLEDAEVSYRKAIMLKPEFAEAHYNLGNTLRNLGRLEGPEASYRKAIALKPDYSEAHCGLGIALQDLGRLEESEASYRKAIALEPDFAAAHYNLGITLWHLGRIKDAKASYRKAITLKPNYTSALWNLYGTAQSIAEAKNWIDECLAVDTNHVDAKLTSAALKYYQGDKADFDGLMQSDFKHHALMRSFAWAFSLSKLPSLYFCRWAFFDAIVDQSLRSRPFYEFGVWRGESFKYLIKTFKKGYGFDTFTGLPEDWHVGKGKYEKAGAYSSDGNIPKIEGGEFIAGKFDDTLPIFFSEPRPLASVINFDADLYPATICALNYSRQVMDKQTVLIFDQLIAHECWEQGEFKALNEFVAKNNCTYEVVAISFFTKQVAVKLIGI